jgi:hypothetical protein
VLPEFGNLSSFLDVLCFSHLSWEEIAFFSCSSN